MSIYITGDTHGDPQPFLSSRFSHLQKEDTLIIAGDFGYLFYDSEFENAFLDMLAQNPFQICFVDGNHENFHAIARYPVIQNWNGGSVHKIRNNIFHLMRGQIYTLEDKTIFTLGGAYSRDRIYRTPGVSWWPEELPSSEEYDQALNALKLHDNRVDIIITHTIPFSVVAKLGQPDDHEAELNRFLEHILHSVRFKHWYAGHWHVNRDFHIRTDASQGQEPDFTILFEQVRKIP